MKKQFLRRNHTTRNENLFGPPLTFDPVCVVCLLICSSTRVIFQHQQSLTLTHPSNKPHHGGRRLPRLADWRAGRRMGRIVPFSSARLYTENYPCISRSSRLSRFSRFSRKPPSTNCRVDQAQTGLTSSSWTFCAASFTALPKSFWMLDILAPGNQWARRGPGVE